MSIINKRQKIVVVCIDNVKSLECDEFKKISDRDLYIINVALDLKRLYGYTTVVVNTDLGYIQNECEDYYISEDVLKYALFNGIDKAISIKPKIGINTNIDNIIFKSEFRYKIIGNSISAFLRKIDNYDIILCGSKNNHGISKIGTLITNNLHLSQSCSVTKILTLSGTRTDIIKRCQYNNKILSLLNPSVLTLINNSKVNNTPILSAKRIMQYNLLQKNEKKLDINDPTTIDEFTIDITDMFNNIVNLTSKIQSIKNIKKINILPSKILTRKYIEEDFNNFLKEIK